MSQDDIDASEAPLMDHLMELRSRLVWSVDWLCCCVSRQVLFFFRHIPLVGEAV